MSLNHNVGAMPTTTKKEKHYANSRAHRGSIVTVSHSGSKKTKKDNDTESVSSDASTVVPPPPPKPQCPLRPYMEVMFESEESDEKKKSLCPLRRVKLSHTIPLCIFVMINMCLVIGTLLITGVCRLAATLLDWGQKPSKETDKDNNVRIQGYVESIQNPDVSAILFLMMAVFAFFVTICYGPDWMRTAFQICTTIGFFVGVAMAMLAKQGSMKMPTTTSESCTTAGS
jgi:hypothetical protein